MRAGPGGVSLEAPALGARGVSGPRPAGEGACHRQRPQAARYRSGCDGAGEAWLRGEARDVPGQHPDSNGLAHRLVTCPAGLGTRCMPSHWKGAPDNVGTRGGGQATCHGGRISRRGAADEPAGERTTPGGDGRSVRSRGPRPGRTSEAAIGSRTVTPPTPGSPTLLLHGCPKEPAATRDASDPGLWSRPGEAAQDAARTGCAVAVVRR